MSESKQISLLTFLKTYVQVLLIRQLNELLFIANLLYFHISYDKKLIYF